MNEQRKGTQSEQSQGMQDCASEFVQHNPFASVTVLYGTGIAVGLLLGHIIAEATGRHVFHEETFPERLTSQIRDLLKNNLPQQLTRHLS